MVSNWQQACSVGHPALDEQHRGFFNLCRVADACRLDKTREGGERFHELLNELVNYAHRHFLFEEKLLAASGYPDLDAHKAEHELYKEKLTHFVIEATFGDLNKEGLFGYLADWWASHILESDLKYRDYVAALNRE